MNSISAFIMQEYIKYNDYIKINMNIQKINDDILSCENDIVIKLSELQKCKNVDIKISLNNSLEALNNNVKKLENSRKNIIYKEFEEMKKRYPGILDKFMDGISKETLISVLTTFDNYSKGDINKDQAYNVGVDYMTKQYNLPKDFYVRK